MIACLTLAVAFFSMVGAASSEKEDPLDGKWDTNWGLVKLFQDDQDVDGWWECNCPNGRRAVIDFELNEKFNGDLIYEDVTGNWKCPGAGEDARGRFKITFRREKTKFAGRYWTKGERDDWERWQGVHEN